jgi:hypothetical protein
VCMVTMRLELEEGLHRRLKVWSFKNGRTMTGAVRHLIGELVGHDERDAELREVAAAEVRRVANAGFPVLPNGTPYTYVDQDEFKAQKLNCGSAAGGKARPTAGSESNPEKP